MKIVTGTDIVHIPTFEENTKKGGGAFLKKCFCDSELNDQRTAHLVGIFAAKEAVMKAFSLRPGSWLDIEIKKNDDGRPEARISGTGVPHSVSSDLSISHDKEYAVAVFVAILS